MVLDTRPDGSTAALASTTWTVLGVPFRGQTYRNLCYLALAFPLGVAYVVLFSLGLGFGVALSFVVVGVPILLATLALAVGVAGVERWLATLLLDVEVPPRRRPDADSPVERVRALVTARGTWAALAYAVTKIVFGTAAFVLVMSCLVTAVGMLAVPLAYDQPGVYVGVVTDAPVSYHPALYVGWDRLLVGVETVVTVSAWRVTNLGEALAVAGVGACLAVVTLHLLNALAWVSGQYTRLLLGGRDDAEVA